MVLQEGEKRLDIRNRARPFPEQPPHASVSTQSLIRPRNLRVHIIRRHRLAKAVVRVDVVAASNVRHLQACRARLDVERPFPTRYHEVERRCPFRLSKSVQSVTKAWLLHKQPEHQVSRN